MLMLRLVLINNPLAPTNLLAGVEQNTATSASRQQAGKNQQ